MDKILVWLSSGANKLDSKVTALLGHAMVTQASFRGSFLFTTKVGKRPVGVERPPGQNLPDHRGKNEIVHPVLLVTLLAQMCGKLRPVPDAVQQRMNKNLATAGGEFAG